MTELPGGGRARDGFAALAALDEDGDGQITARDPAFKRLVLWRDTDQDRRSGPGELVAVADAGLVAIRLDYDVVPICDDGNCEPGAGRCSSSANARGHEPAKET